MLWPLHQPGGPSQGPQKQSNAPAPAAAVELLINLTLIVCLIFLGEYTDFLFRRTMFCIFVGNFIFLKVNWLRWAGPGLARLHPLFNAEEIDDLGEKIFSIETETLVMLNCTKNTLKILESDYISNFITVIIHMDEPRETTIVIVTTSYWDEMSTWDPTCYNDGVPVDHHMMMIRAGNI